MNDNRTPIEIEEDGFIKMAAVALGANMAAATIHSGIQLNWQQIVPRSMEGARAFWKAFKEDRDARSQIGN